MRSREIVLTLVLVGCGAATTSSNGTTGRGAAPSDTTQGTVPVPLSPAELLPNDLDLVLRVDAARMRGLSMGTSGSELAELLPRLTGVNVPKLLATTEVLTIGWRWPSDGRWDDRVVAAEGPDDTGPGATTWRTVESAVAGMRVSVANAAHPLRGDPVLWVDTATGWAKATSGEADALFRVASQGHPDTDRLDPPASGIASIVIRGRHMPVSDAPSGPREAFLARIVEGLVKASLAIGVGDGLELRGDMEYATEARARAAVVELERGRAAITSTPERFPKWTREVSRLLRVEARSSVVVVSLLGFRVEP